MSELKAMTLDELFDYVETPEAIAKFSWGEKQFRKGYHHAIIDVIDAIREGVLPRQFLQYEDIVHKWHYDGNYDEDTPPPKMPKAWSKVRKRILKRDKNICHYCGKEADTVDHKIPVISGGTDDDENLVACCRKCNSKKHTTSYDDFIYQRGRV